MSNVAEALELHKSQRFHEAAAAWQGVLAQDPGNIAALVNLARIYLRWRQVDAAEPLIARAQQLQPDAPQIHGLIGDALQTKGEHAAAIKAYEACATRGGAAATAGKIDSCRFILENMGLARRARFRADLLEFGLTAAPATGLFLEFGVAAGHSLRFIAALHDGPVYGFDSFEGLPKDWRPGYSAGAFRGAPPPDLPENAKLVVGSFADSVPQFVREHSGPVSFTHVDCDLYESTRSIFDNLGDRLAAGAILVFDEYLNYDGWREHEHRALAEYLERNNRSVEYIGYVPGGMQVAVRLP